MTRTMKAAVVHHFGRPLAIEEVPVPEPKENQILVRIAATGICYRSPRSEGRLARQAEPALHTRTRRRGDGDRRRPCRPRIKEGIASIRGCIRHAATARTAGLVGRRCAARSRTAAIR